MIHRASCLAALLVAVLRLGELQTYSGEIQPHSDELPPPIAGSDASSRIAEGLVMPQPPPESMSIAGSIVKGMWVGVKPGTTLKIPGQTVPAERLPALYEVQVKEVDTGRTWFWLKRAGTRGWVFDSDIIAPDDAIEWLNKAMTVECPASLYKQRGLLELGKGRASEAMKKPEQAWQEYEQAVADFSEAIRLDPNDPDARGNRAIAQSMQGDIDLAIVDLSLAILQYDNPRVERLAVPFLIQRGSLYRLRSIELNKKSDTKSFDTTNIDQSLDDINHALRLDPKNVAALRERELSIDAHPKPPRVGQIQLTLPPNTVDGQKAVANETDNILAPADTPPPPDARPRPPVAVPQ